MLILVINSGSSSVKYQLFNTYKKKSVVRGVIEKIGSEEVNLSQKGSKEIGFKKVKASNHKQAIKIVIDTLCSRDFGILDDIAQVSAVGHRVVHGGDKFKGATVINKEVLETIKKYSELAPLHNPPAIKAIEAVKHLLPDMPQVAVFDTAFHQTMPEKAYMYGLPYKYYKKYSLRRYGFHGISHKFVAMEAARRLGQPVTELKLITCHLGNGCSITAVDKGKSVDTSMGFTPLEGLLMGTRCGDLDPAIVSFLMEKESLTSFQMDEILNKNSGLLGISDISNDMREINNAAIRGDKKAQLAIEIFIYRIVKYVGSYYAVMGRMDALIFTAGIGENQKDIREKIAQSIKPLLDSNDTKVMVIPTDEELMIAKETEEILSQQVA